MTAEPLGVPVARTQSPFFRFARVPAACLSIFVFDVIVTLELPVLVTVVEIVNVLPAIDVTAPETTPVTEAAPAAGTPIATNPAHAASIARAPVRRVWFLIQRGIPPRPEAEQKTN